MAELEIADAVAVVLGRWCVAADACGDPRSATTAACPSENTPAFGVPTLVTSPTAYTSGNDVSSVRGSTGIQPSTVMPADSTTGRRAVLRDTEEQVVGHLRPVAEHGHAAGRVERAHQRPGMPCDAALGERAQERFRRGGRRRDRHRQRHDQRDLGLLPHSPAHEVVVHQQRRLARRGRTLERRRRDRDDHPPPVEPGEDVTQRERPLLCVELVPALDEPGCRARLEVGAERDHEDVCLERTVVSLDSLRDRIDRLDVRLYEAHARLDEVAVPMTDSRRHRPPEHHFEL